MAYYKKIQSANYYKRRATFESKLIISAVIYYKKARFSVNGLLRCRCIQDERKVYPSPSFSMQHYSSQAADITIYLMNSQVLFLTVTQETLHP